MSSFSLEAPTTNPQAARFPVITSPNIDPGHCGACGKASHSQGFVHTGMDFEFFGTLIFCADCAKEIGRAVGCLDPEQTVKVNNVLAEAIDENYSLRSQLEQLEAVRDAFNKYRNSVILDNDIADPPISNVRELFQPTESYESITEAVVQPEQSDPSIAESVSGERSDDSSDVSSGDDILTDILGI